MSTNRKSAVILYKEDYPWDVRVEKIAKSLAAMEYDVTIVCQNMNRRPRRETIDGFRIRRLPGLHNAPNLIRRLVNYALWMNPFWFSELLFALIARKTNLIVIRDLPLTLTAIALGRLFRIPVILDMAECYPELYKSRRRFAREKGLEKILKSPALAGMYEKFVLAIVDQVFVVIEESHERLMSIGASPNKVFIVSNTPVLPKRIEKPKEHSGEDLRIIYVGFLGEIRGLDILVKAVHDFVGNAGKDLGVRLDIIGKGATEDDLRHLVKTLGLEKQIFLHGWLPHDQVDLLMRAANVGALTYRVCEHWNTTIPNKIFDYMLSGLPVLATDPEPIKRIIKETQCGLLCRDQDTSDMARQLVKLKDPTLRNKLGSNGHEAVLTKYNWKRERMVIADAIEKLNHAHRPGPRANPTDQG